MTSKRHDNNQTLTGYYDNLPANLAPKTEFVRTIAKKCNLDVFTVRGWVKGRTKPRNEDHIKILVKATGIPAENLFNE